MGDLSWLDKLFLFCAVLGGALFIARMILMFMGAGHGGDIGGGDVHVDLGGGHDFDAGHDATGHSAADSSDASFKLITFQGITGFFLMFGLAGLIISLILRNPFISVLAAVAAGGGTMWLVAKFFVALMGLQSSGTLDVKNAIGQEGTVYLHIPVGGTGKVQVPVQGRLEEFEATSDSKVEIKSGEKVRVVFIKGNVLVVEKI